MGYSYVIIDGQRVEVNVAADYRAMEAEFRRVFGLDLIISSGTRTRAEQAELYRRWKNGTGNLAAAPGYSNHEEDGPRGPRALDLRDSGSDAGVTVIGSRRSNWLASNCKRFQFTNAGHYFSPREGWHYENTGAVGGSGGSPAGVGGALAEDGELGAATISAMQRVLGVGVDGQWGPATTTALQKKLIAMGHKIAADGDLGPATIKALQTFLLGHKLADGDMGPQTIRGLQHYLNAGGKFVIVRPAAPGKLAEDGQLGPQTIEKLQAVVGAKVDGQMGPDTVRKLQARLGVAADGELGPATVSALQARVGAKVDGDWGSATTKALQAHLNAGGTLAGTPAPPKPTAPAKIAVDGELGPETVKRLQASLGVAQDGEWGPDTTRALQKAVGARVDGELGPQTIKAVQVNVGAEQDGQMGPETVRKLQEFLNSGKPWQAVEVTPQPQPSGGFVVKPRDPVYPGAAAGWDVPLGQSSRGKSPAITHLIVHHETAFTSQVPYFKTANDRGSCPTWEVNGKVVTEMIHPALRPSATGSANSYSVAIETTNTAGEPDWKVSDDSVESIIAIGVWLVKLSASDNPYLTAPDGSKVKVAVTADRQHIIGHKEAGVNATRCPGEFLMSKLDYIVEQVALRSQPDPVEPPEEEMVTVRVPRSKLQAFYDWLKGLLGK